MRGLKLVLAAAFGLSAVAALSAADPKKGKPCDFPTKPGKYEAGGWQYTYEIQAPKTRSEKRIGTLKKGGKEVAGKMGDVMETPLGKFKYYDTMYNKGWLNTLTYDKPVFPEDGAKAKSKEE